MSEKVTSIGGMMTIPVKEGTNEISLHYQAKGRVSGAVISFAAILLCFSVWLLQRKGFFGLHLQKAQTAAAWIVYILFMLAFAAFIAAYVCASGRVLYADVIGVRWKLELAKMHNYFQKDGQNLCILR